MIRLYEALAREAPHEQLRFLNYGYSPRNPDFRWIHPGDECFKYHLALAREVLSGVGLDGAQVLEVGCGRGGNCSYLASYTGATRIVGCDLSSGNISFCGRTYDDPRLTFVQGDAESLPFADGSFDVVVNIESSHCYPDLACFLAEVRRVLRIGGTLAYADFWHLKAFRDDWNNREEQFRNAPLALDRCEDITQYVFKALHEDDGLSALLSGIRTDENSDLIDWLLETNTAMEVSLAARLGIYRLCRFHKPHVEENR